MRSNRPKGGLPLTPADAPTIQPALNDHEVAGKSIAVTVTVTATETESGSETESGGSPRIRFRVKCECFYGEA